MFRTGYRHGDSPAVRLGIFGMLAVLVLGGCAGSGGDPGEAAGEGGTSTAVAGGTASDPEAESVAASPAPTPTTAADAYKPASAEGPAENVPLPVMPEVAKEKSKEGLEAFARHWFSLVNYGYETGDTNPVKELSGPECELCQEFYAGMEKGYAGDDWVQGGTLSIVALGTKFVVTSNGRYQVILSIKEADGYDRGPNGVLYKEHIASEYSFAQLMEATYLHGGWIVDLVEHI